MYQTDKHLPGISIPSHVFIFFLTYPQAIVYLFGGSINFRKIVQSTNNRAFVAVSEII